MEPFKRTHDATEARLAGLDRVHRTGRFYTEISRRDERPSAAAFAFHRALLLGEHEHAGTASVRLEIDMEARRNG